MSLRFARRAASEMLERGVSAIRFKPSAKSDIEKAITRDDIRKLITDGSIYPLPEKHNISANSKIMRKKREEGRRRGLGRRKGTLKARTGSRWEKKVRSQRIMLRKLREMQKLDNKSFHRFYKLIKGNAFADKASLLLHLRDEGIKISDEEVAKISESMKAMYK